jgi:hypothetical protein
MKIKTILEGDFVRFGSASDCCTTFLAVFGLVINATVSVAKVRRKADTKKRNVAHPSQSKIFMPFSYFLKI